MMRPTAARGLSPRVRGNLCSCHTRIRRRRSIPACAGEPSAYCHSSCGIRVYPRVCGGTAGRDQQEPLVGGLSPRVRGNRPGHPNEIHHTGSIPACAGEPGSHPVWRWGLKVYPRVCGGTREFARITVSREGLSPRVRGNPFAFSRYATDTRSIPACAGEPTRERRTGLVSQVYPRVCG